MTNLPHYAVLEAKDKDSTCPIMITEGQFESFVYVYYTVNITDDGVLKFDYDLLEKPDSEYDKQAFENTIGDLLVHMIEEQMSNDNRNEYTESSDSQ